MKYARIVDNKVWEVFTPPVGVDISDCFTAELVAQFIECHHDWVTTISTDFRRVKKHFCIKNWPAD